MSDNEEHSLSGSPSPMQAENLPAVVPHERRAIIDPDEFTVTASGSEEEEEAEQKDSREGSGEAESALERDPRPSGEKQYKVSVPTDNHADPQGEEKKEKEEEIVKPTSVTESIFLNVSAPSRSPLMLLYSFCLQAPRYIFILLQLFLLSSFLVSLYQRLIDPIVKEVDQLHYPVSAKTTNLLAPYVFSPLRLFYITKLALFKAGLFLSSTTLDVIAQTAWSNFLETIKIATNVNLQQEWKKVSVSASTTVNPVLSMLFGRENSVRLLGVRRIVWKTPAAAFVFFGLLFYGSNALLLLWELTYCLVRGVVAVLLYPLRKRRAEVQPEHQKDNCRPLTRFAIRRNLRLWCTDLSHILLYNNGYNSLIRLAFALLEMVWLMQFGPTVLLSPFPDGSFRNSKPYWANCWGFSGSGGKPAGSGGKDGKDAAKPKDGGKPAAAAPSNGNNIPLPIPKALPLASSWNTILSGSARCYVRHPTLVFQQVPYALPAMKLILIVVAIIEIQRLFNALVGVRPFALRDGWESCPLCRMRWRQSTRSSRVIHKCYVLLNKSERRVGDHFQDSDHASFWSKITYSWVSPFLSVALCTPFGFFGVPADVDQKKDAQTYWEVLNEATRRLPRLPADMSTRENLDNPAWALWRYQNKSKKELAELKKEGKLPDALPRQGALEGIFLWLTKPIRAVLSRAFVLFFLPSSVKKKTTTEKENPTEKSKPMKKKKGLFQLFMQHPSGKQYVYTCVPLKLAQDFLSLVAPLVVKKLVDFLRVAGMAVGDPAQGSSSHFMRGLTVVAMLVVVVLLQVIIFQYYLTHLYSSSMKATGALKALISRHTLATPTAFGFQSAPKQEERLLSPVTQSPRPGSPQQPRSLSASMGRQSSPLPENAEPKKAAQGGLSKEGEAISLLSIDAGNCGECLIFLHNVWGHPLVIFSSLFTMYSYVGVFATLCTFLTLVALIPFNRYSAGLVRVAQAAAKNNGGRISDLTASLVNMRTVKSMALEEFITDRIKTARKSESEGMGKVIRAEGFAAAHTELTTLVITLVCFGSYLIGGGKMDAAVLVPTMAALNVMRFPVWTLPHVFSQVSKGYNSMKRIEAYLDLQEEESEKRGGVPADGVEYAAQVAEVRRTTPVGTVTCDGCSFCWSRPPPGTMEETIPGSPRGFPVVNGLAAPPVIHNIEMHIQPGEFALIQGATGSGKSALLLSIMGELYPLPPADRIDQEGFVGFKVGGRLAYCAEIPWLRNRTVRENIRMVPDHHPETEEEKAWYKEVIHASGLRSDLDAMALGDMTVVGESGGKLSGGQRARVAIARAAYRRNDADVFVFDDILSALDVEVQKHIIREVLRGLLKGKTIIMASHLSPHTLLPDRLFTMRGSGGLKEATWTKPTEKDVELLEQSWQKASPQRSASLLGSSTRSQPEVMQRIRRSKRMKQRDEEDTHKRLLLQDSTTKTEKKPDKQQNFSLIPSREDLYILFIKFMGTRRLIMVFITSVLLQLVRSFTDNWLGIWFSLHREVYDDKTISGTTVHMIQRGLNTMLDFIKSRQPPPPPPTSKNFFLHYFSSLDAVVVQFLVSYAAIGILAAILSYWKTRTFSLSYQRIANALQFHAVSKIFKAPVSYFDRVPSSGLLQVLSRDQDIVDRSLGESIQLIFTSGLQVFGVMCFSASQQSAFIAVIPICVLLFYNLTLRFLLTSKQVRTLEGKLGAMSMEVLKESVSGAVTVRAYGSEAIERMQEEMNDSLDKFNCVGFMGLMSDRWVGLRLEIVSLLLTSTLALLSVFAVCFPAAPVTGKKVKVDRGAVSAGAAFAGLGVVSSMTAARSLSMLCRRIGLFQTQYVSAEQLLRLYREVPQEGGEESTALTTKQVTNVLEPLDQQWSSRLFQKVSQLPPVLRVVSLSGKYQAHLPYVLTNITFNLKPGECVGLIGRSGNGKSSLFNALLQLMDVLQGSVGIPHVDPSGTLTLRAVNANALKLPHQNVRALRQNYFQLVSQEPFLLQGTVRDNLLLGIDHEAGNREEGPYSDRALWRALKRVKFDELLIQALPPPAGGPGVSDDNSDAGNAGTQEKTAPPSRSASSTNLCPDIGDDEEAQFLLNYTIQAQGSNLSAGQRQLLCLARTLLREPRVVLLDEVSSRVDQTTDLLIQEIITEEILLRKKRPNAEEPPSTPLHQRDSDAYYHQDITPARGDDSEEDEEEGEARQRPRRQLVAPSGVLLIAHRLNTIMSLCDRVLVVEEGCIVADLKIDEVGAIEDLESLL